MVVRVSCADSERIRITLTAASNAMHERREVAISEFAETRPHDEQHADKTRHHREPAPGPDLLLQHEQRKQGDEEGRNEDQRVDFGERDRGEGDDAEDAGEAPDSARACTAQGRFMRQKWSQFSSFGVVSTMQMLEISVGVKTDLEDGEAAAERLHGRVAPRVDGIGEERQQDSVVHAGLSDDAQPDRRRFPRITCHSPSRLPVY